MTRSSMVSQSSTLAAEPTTEPAVMVLPLGDGAALDYATFATRAGANVAGQGGPAEGVPASVVLWLPARLTDAARTALDEGLGSAIRRDAQSLVLIGSVRAHLDDEDALAVERY